MWITVTLGGLLGLECGSQCHLKLGRDTYYESPDLLQGRFHRSREICGAQSYFSYIIVLITDLGNNAVFSIHKMYLICENTEDISCLSHPISLVIITAKPSSAVYLIFVSHSHKPFSCIISLNLPSSWVS